MSKLEVIAIPKGPLKVAHAESLTFCGEPLPVEGDLYLCRCGESKNAPFCDGSHAQVGFTGEPEERAEKEVRVWEGRKLRTFFDPNVCMHVYYCKPLKELRAAELAGDDAAGPEIMRVIGTCPSGALSYELKEPCADEPAAPTGRPDVEVMEGGEIRLQTVFDANFPLRERQTDDKATLCRCGLSANKPFCDGRHRARKNFR